MAKDLKKLIKDKVVLNVEDEVYGMEDDGTFASPSDAVRRHITVVCTVVPNMRRNSYMEEFFHNKYK